MKPVNWTGLKYLRAVVGEYVNESMVSLLVSEFLFVTVLELCRSRLISII